MESFKAFVTGGTGFIGSHLVEELVKNNVETRILVRDRQKAVKLFRGGVEIVEGDLLELSLLEEVVKNIDVVFHLASIINIGNVSNEYYYRINVNGTENLLKASLKNGVKKIIFSSSVNVYSPFSKEPFTEESWCEPDEILGRTKLEAENIIKKYCEGSELNYVNLRIARVYGPRDFSLLKLFQQINSGFFLMIGNGKGLIQPIYVKDVVNALILSARKEDVKNETIIIAGPEVLNKRDFCIEIANLFDKKISSFYIPSFIAIPPIYLIEKLFVLFGKDPIISRRRVRFFLTSQSFKIDKAREILGFEPKIKIREGLKLTAEWYKENNLL